MSRVPVLTQVQSLDPAQLLATLRPVRPRLLLTPQRMARVETMLIQHELARGLKDRLLTYGAQLALESPNTERTLAGARTVLDRLYTWVTLYHLTQAPHWVQRSVRELQATAALADWCADDFLACAEFMHGFAMALDSLPLTEGQRDELQAALVAKGLQPALEKLTCLPWWHRDTCNWNIVCNSGIILGALAAAEAAPRLSARLISQALAGLPNALATFAPDGGWPEGPGYWAYSMRYLVPLVTALENALGHDFGISQFAGLDRAAYFRLHMESPAGRLFDYADAYGEAPPEPCLGALAQRYRLPAVAAFLRQTITARPERPHLYYGTLARLLLWYDPQGTRADLAELPLDACFVGVDVAAFRASWLDPQAAYLAVKGGDIQAPHAHADLGTFVLDVHGTRFITDLGGDHYDLPGYWNGRPNTDYARWRLYRTGTMGHNTLLVGPGQTGQYPLATAALRAFVTGPEAGSVTVDLTEAYAPAGLTSALRTVQFDRTQRRVMVCDALNARTPTLVTSRLHTYAQVRGEGNTYTLRQDGQQIILRAWGTGAVRVTVQAVNLAPPAKPTPGLQRIDVQMEVAGPGELVVELAW
ncbi:MAG: heparinase II/III family protein [Phycisphaerae bacterium]